MIIAIIGSSNNLPISVFLLSYDTKSFKRRFNKYLCKQQLAATSNSSIDLPLRNLSRQSLTDPRFYKPNR